MKPLRTALLVLLIGLAAAPAGAQDAARLYRQGVWLEQVERSPRKALEVYQRLLETYPHTGLRQKVLARLADLHLRLNQLQPALKALARLEREGLGPEAKSDLARLKKAAVRVKKRQRLLRRIQELRRRLKTLKRKRGEAQGPAATPEALQAQDRVIASLEQQLQKLRPQLAALNVPALQVKEKSTTSRYGSQEARKLAGEIDKLRGRVRALEEAGKVKEAVRARRELERMIRDYGRRFPQPRRPWWPRMRTKDRNRMYKFLAEARIRDLRRQIETNIHFRWVLISLVFIGDELAKMPAKVRPKYLQALDILVGRQVEAQSRSNPARAASLRATWNRAKNLLRTGDYPRARRVMGELMPKIRPHRFRRNGKPSPRPGRPGGRGGTPEKPPQPPRKKL